MFCSRCGMNIPKGGKYCEKCGARVTDFSRSMGSPYGMNANPNGMNVKPNGMNGFQGRGNWQPNGMYGQPGGEKKSKAPFVLLFSGIGIFLLAVVIVFLLFFREEDNAFAGVWAEEGSSEGLYFEEDGTVYRGSIESGFHVSDEMEYELDGDRAVIKDHDEYYTLSDDEKHLTYFEKGEKDGIYGFYSDSMKKTYSSEAGSAEPEESVQTEETKEPEEDTDEEDSDEEDSKEEDEAPVVKNGSEENVVNYIRKVYGETDDGVNDGYYQILYRSDYAEEYWDGEWLRLAILDKNADERFRVEKIKVNYYYDEDQNLIFAWGFQYVSNRRREYRAYYGTDGKVYKYLEYCYKKDENPDTKEVKEKHYEKGIEPLQGSIEQKFYDKGSKYVFYAMDNPASYEPASQEQEEDSEEMADSDYILPQSSSRKLKKSDLEGLSKRELRLARNEIYARHGRRFDDEELQDYFDSKEWYSGYIDPDDFVDSEELSEIERRNAKYIKKFE